MRICQRCGASHDDGARRCAQCGYSTLVDLPPEPADVREPDLATARRPAWRWPRAPKRALSAAALVVTSLLAPRACDVAAIALVDQVPPHAAGTVPLALMGLAMVLATIARHGRWPLAVLGLLGAVMALRRPARPTPQPAPDPSPEPPPLAFARGKALDQRA